LLAAVFAISFASFRRHYFPPMLFTRRPRCCRRCAPPLPPSRPFADAIDARLRLSFRRDYFATLMPPGAIFHFWRGTAHMRSSLPSILPPRQPALSPFAEVAAMRRVLRSLKDAHMPGRFAFRYANPSTIHRYVDCQAPDMPRLTPIFSSAAPADPSDSFTHAAWRWRLRLRRRCFSGCRGRRCRFDVTLNAAG